MSDVSFPARLAVTSEDDLDGLPILTATVTPSAEATTLSLPEGPAGPAGPRGTARTTFQKMGEIATAAARPTGLGPADRGKWWHRLDTNGMDYWDGSTWIHSPGAVGAQGPVAPAATITPTTVHNENLTTPAVKITATGASMALQATPPAGLQGPAGPTGSSGTISSAPDYDNTTGPTQRSMFGYQAAARKWRTLPAPNGFGPWGWYGDDFNANAQSASNITVGTFPLPVLQWAWRPMVWVAGLCQLITSSGSYPILTARLNTPNGVMVAYGAGLRASSASGQLYHLTAVPTFGDDGPKPLSPNSSYASIPAGEQATLVVQVEKVGSATTDLIWNRTDATAIVWAHPVQGA